MLGSLMLDYSIENDLHEDASRQGSVGIMLESKTSIDRAAAAYAVAGPESACLYNQVLHP